MTAPARIALADAPQEGEILMVELGAHDVGLVRLGDSFHALADRCPHRGAPLCSSGELHPSLGLVGGAVAVGSAPALLRCPWHKWDFDVATGRCTVDQRLRVRTYAVTIEGDELVVSLARPEPQGL